MHTLSEHPMDTPKSALTSFRIQRLELTNFKALDHLVLDFPPPMMPDEPDIHVLGSRNGVGKTSVLEACMLLFLGNLAAMEHHTKVLGPQHNMHELFIKSDCDAAGIDGIFTCIEKELKKMSASLHMKRGNYFGPRWNMDFDNLLMKTYKSDAYSVTKKLIDNLYGHDPEPLIHPPYLFFHSNRKIREGHPTLSSLINKEEEVSTFKKTCLHIMMARSGLFETIESQDGDKALDQLNQLIGHYADGKIDKLRPSSGNTIDIRITHLNNRGSFTFDSLSSGQKEIISTLFMIWYHTRNTPSIVLIDEAELHLNNAWHWDFVRQVYKLAPNNQYIITTHSADIFESVRANQRILLEIS
ncbi:AAA family ATPase [Magnetococcales bacterium HHB-1]